MTFPRKLQSNIDNNNNNSNATTSSPTLTDEEGKWINVFNVIEKDIPIDFYDSPFGWPWKNHLLCSMKDQSVWGALPISILSNISWVVCKEFDAIAFEKNQQTIIGNAKLGDVVSFEETKEATSKIICKPGEICVEWKMEKIVAPLSCIRPCTGKRPMLSKLESKSPHLNFPIGVFVSVLYFPSKNENSISLAKFGDNYGSFDINSLIEIPHLKVDVQNDKIAQFQGLPEFVEKVKKEIFFLFSLILIRY